MGKERLRVWAKEEDDAPTSEEGGKQTGRGERRKKGIGLWWSLVSRANSAFKRLIVAFMHDGGLLLCELHTVN